MLLLDGEILDSITLHKVNTRVMKYYDTNSFFTKFKLSYLDTTVFTIISHHSCSMKSNFELAS
jgi:hypothetical protein